MYVIEKKIIKSPTVDGDLGSFSLESPVDFEYCRDKFAVSFTESTPGFYFMHRPNDGLNIDAFLEKIEEILGHKTHSRFVSTNRERITWVEPIGFWRECPMRRSLLTLFLRAGMFYERGKGNFDEALFSEPYLVRTKKAVMRFLFGFTRYIGPTLEVTIHSSLATTGWRAVFEFKDSQYVKQNLLLPEGQNAYRAKIDLGDALWV